MPPPRAMSMPVRRWANIELSPMACAPSRRPNSTTAATNSDSTDGARSRERGRERLIGGTPPFLSPISTQEVVIGDKKLQGRALEVVADVDDGGPDHDDEQGREDAEHHREEHLDGRLLGLLL